MKDEWTNSRCVCPICKKIWIATHPIGVKNLECPGCNYMVPAFAKNVEDISNEPPLKFLDKVRVIKNGFYEGATGVLIGFQEQSEIFPQDTYEVYLDSKFSHQIHPQRFIIEDLEYVNDK